ncbi:MAG: glycoside hydrolase family 32 protein [Cyclobacteriaceae bacterium]|nr:glycoside hydrolase family 32 protein [Cyclobacteriaceae bacterium]
MKRIVLMLLIFFSCSRNETPDSHELHRPYFHFTPPSGWMNDPNGLVYHNGVYHLFYQHYPDSTVWGPMHWGHAISKNLVNWEHLPIALYPDSLGYIFSGSAVVDEKNTSGLQKGSIPPLVALFTYDKQGFETQGLAFSNDDGLTWQKYDKNPVINNPGEKDFRDPKVFRHAETESWIMSLAVKDHIEFYRSKNLLQWEKTGEFGRTYGSHGGVWECPDLFPLTDVKTGITKWILLVSINPGGPNGGSATQYFIGKFDGQTFTCDDDSTVVRWLDYGPDNYAGVTWNNAPGNRRIFIGWMSNWNYGQLVPSRTWRSAMTVPRELGLTRTASGFSVYAQPVPELHALRRAEHQVQTGKAISFNGRAELDLSFDLSVEGEPQVEFQNSKNEVLRIGFDRTSNRFYIDRSKSGTTNFSDKFSGISYASRLADLQQVKMHLIVDVASVELFADDGLTCMTAIFFPTENFNRFIVPVKNSSMVTGTWFELEKDN